MNTATARQINKPGSIDKAVKPGAAGAGAKPKRAPMGKEQKHQLIVIGIAAAVVCSVGVAIYAYFNYSRTSHKPPRLDAAPVVMAKFIATNDFDHLPFDRQRLYMKELSGKKKELEEQYKAGNLSKNDLEDALSVVWLGKQFKHLDHYYSLGELDKKNYLDELIEAASFTTVTVAERSFPVRGEVATYFVRLLTTSSGCGPNPAPGPDRVNGVLDPVILG